MKSSSAFLVVTLCFCGTAFAEDFAKTTFKSSSGRDLHYASLAPSTIEATSKYPLVITLHGIAGRGAAKWERNCYANRVLASAEMRRRYPCFVVAPTVAKPSYWVGEPMEDVIELIESLLTELPIDPQRIYVTGQSMGGYGSFAAVTARPDLFAAAAPVCGASQTDNAASMAGVPMWIFHGAKDRTVPVERSREMVEAIKQAGGNPKYTEFPDAGHDAWTPAYDNEEFWEWLFAQRSA